MGMFWIFFSEMSFFNWRPEFSKINWTIDPESIFLKIILIEIYDSHEKIAFFKIIPIPENESKLENR